jgi:hypothetical protein
MKPAVFGLTVPLLLAPSGEKFGKSAGNALFLDSNATHPFDLYQVFQRPNSHACLTPLVVFSSRGGRTRRTIFTAAYFAPHATNRRDYPGAHENSRTKTCSKNSCRRSYYPNSWPRRCPKMYLSDRRAVSSSANRRKTGRQAAWVRIGVDITRLSRR